MELKKRLHSTKGKWPEDCSKSCGLIGAILTLPPRKHL